MSSAEPTAGARRAHRPGGRSWLIRRDDSRRAHDLAIDVACAAGLTGLAQLQVWQTAGLQGNRTVVAVMSAVLTGSFVLRRTRPLGVVGVVCLYFALTIAAGHNTADVMFFPSAALMLASYSVAAHGPGRVPLIGAGAVVALIVGATAAGALRLQEAFFVVIFNAAAWTGGQLIRTRDEQVDALETAGAAQRREAEERTRRAVADERARIARELHDLVSHGLAAIALEAAGAERVAEREPIAARRSLEAIRHTAGEAATELRRLLDVMSPASSGPENRPGGIPELVARVRARGLEVELATTGELESLPPGLGLVTYRVVQEALTNVIKHAPSGRASVTLRRDASALEVVVANTGVAAGSPQVGAGHGLIGMRERVTLYGGELEAGPLPGGGFRVRALMPLGLSP